MILLTMTEITLARLQSRAVNAQVFAHIDAQALVSEIAALSSALHERTQELDAAREISIELRVNLAAEKLRADRSKSRSDAAEAILRRVRTFGESRTPYILGKKTATVRSANLGYARARAHVRALLRVGRGR